MCKKIFLCCGLLIGLAACSSEDSFEDQEAEIAQVQVPTIEIGADHEALFACQSPSEVLAFLNQRKDWASAYFQSNDWGQLSETLFRAIQNPELRKFREQTLRIFPKDSLQAEFKTAFQHLLYFYPQAKLPKIRTMFTGFMGVPLLAQDSVIVLSLDFFAGSKAAYRPTFIEKFMLKRYEPGYLVPQALVEWAPSYNQQNRQDKTLLADVIFHGKNLEFAQTLLPTRPDSLFLPYTNQQLDECEENQSAIWAHFIEEKLFFQTSDFIKIRYISERPRTIEIGSACPGQIGHWLGWKIIRSFVAEHPEVPFAELMRNPKAQQLFEQSNYKGVPRPQE
jgi:hypothetical protein